MPVDVKSHGLAGLEPMGFLHVLLLKESVLLLRHSQPVCWISTCLWQILTNEPEKLVGWHDWNYASAKMIHNPSINLRTFFVVQNEQKSLRISFDTHEYWTITYLWICVLTLATNKTKLNHTKYSDLKRNTQPLIILTLKINCQINKHI